jgi:hypothetical protein
VGDNLKLLGALVATKNLSWDDAQAIAAFCEYADDVCADVLPCLEAGIDLALDFFNDDPDTEAAAEAERVQSSHEDHGPDRGVCPDCGEPSMMDAVDDEQSVDLWMAVRGVVDKYMWDQMQMHDHGETEEC